MAWRRTSLSLALGGLVSLRLLPVLIGDGLWVLPGFFVVIGAVALWITGESRYRAFFDNRIPTSHSLFGARPLLLTAAGTMLLGFGALALVFVLSAR